LRTRETVLTATPAARATSMIVTRFARNGSVPLPSPREARFRGAGPPTMKKT
jgi:hypothetical protein